MTLDEYFALHPSDLYEDYLGHRRPRTPDTLEVGMLQFDEDTASSWGGPFPGNFAFYKLRAHSPDTLVSGPEYQQQWFRREKRKLEAKASLPGIAKRLKNLSPESCTLDFATLERPISLKLMGNDDTSWTLFCETVEQARETLDLLIECQPLSYHDLPELGFLFTN